MKKQPFKPHGIIPAVITPITPEGKFNEKAMRKLLNYLIDGGVHGLFVVGTTGEFYGLSPEEKREIFQVTMDETKGRVPVYAGTNGITTRESVLLTQIAEECKVDAVSILTPMFITHDPCGGNLAGGKAGSSHCRSGHGLAARSSAGCAGCGICDAYVGLARSFPCWCFTCAVCGMVSCRYRRIRYLGQPECI